MLLELITQDGLTPTRKGPDEWCSPCPACGGNDRFVIRPAAGRYWCRQCGSKGDVIEYLRRFRGMTYHQAAEHVGHSTSSSAGHPPRKAQAATRPTPTPPPEAWTAQAKELIAAAHKALVSNEARLEWLRAKRGLTRATAERFRLGWLEQNIYLDRATWGLAPELRDDGTPKKLFIPAGLLIPGPDRLRIRRADPGGNGKYFVIPGSGNAPLTIGTDHQAEMTGAIVVESELDAMLLHQEISDPVMIIACGSTSNGPDAAMVTDLTKRPFVLISLDADKAGAKAAIAKWFSTLPNATPAPPYGGKDHTDAFLSGYSLGEWFAMALNLAVHQAAAKRTEPTIGRDDGVVFRDPISEHQALGAEPAKRTEQGGLIPDFCRVGCEHLRRSELPGLPVVLGCEQYRTSTDWTWSRLDQMKKCPETRTTP